MRFTIPDDCMGQLLECQREIYALTHHKPSFSAIVRDALEKYLGYLHAGR